jgi:hypothetical protein
MRVARRIRAMAKWKLRRKRTTARPGAQAKVAAPAPDPAATRPRRTVLDDGTVIEEGPGGRTFIIPSRPARGIGDPVFWAQRR